MAAAKEIVLRQEAAAVETQQLRRSAEHKTEQIYIRDRELESLAERVAEMNTQKIQSQDEVHSLSTKLEQSLVDVATAREDAKLAQQQAECSCTELQRLNVEHLQLQKDKIALRNNLQTQLDRLRGQELVATSGGPTAEGDNRTKFAEMPSRIQEHRDGGRHGPH